MHRHCDTNNRAPQWTFLDSCKPEARPGAREESASPAWLAAPATNACDTKKVYIRSKQTFNWRCWISRHTIGVHKYNIIIADCLFFGNKIEVPRVVQNSKSRKEENFQRHSRGINSRTYLSNNLSEGISVLYRHA